MDFPQFFTKLFSTSRSLGLSLAVAAYTSLFFRHENIWPWTLISDPNAEYIVVAGTCGAAAFVLSVLTSVWNWATALAGKVHSRWLRQKKANERRAVGLKNLQSMYPVYADTLYYLLCNGIKRFPEKTRNRVLNNMWVACLLERDDPPHEIYGITETYYVVPDYIWDQAETIFSGYNSPLPSSPPWDDLYWRV